MKDFFLIRRLPVLCAAVIATIIVSYVNTKADEPLRPGPPDLSGPPPGPDPTGHPLGISCPPGTSWFSGRCVAVWPLPGPPLVVTTEKGPPPAVNCPLGMISMSGQCVLIPEVLPGRPLTIENRTRQIVQFSLYQPGNFTVPYLTFSLNPGSGDLTQPDRSPLMITPEWGIAAMTANQSLSWPMRALGNFGYEVDATGRYRVVLTEP